MKYIVETQKTFEQTCTDLQAAVVNHQFGVVHIHDMKATLNGKGIPFENDVRVFEVCNPHKANAVLSTDMSLNMALPCRISVWRDNGATQIGMLKPSEIIKTLNDSNELNTVALEVETALIQIIEETQ